MRKLACHLCVLVAVISLILVPGCNSENETKTEMLVIVAGSLVIPMEQIEKEFETAYPDIDLRYEGHGSIQVIRHITELGDPADVALVADYSLLPLLMYPATMENGQNFADWHIQFASNQLGIAYTPESAYSDEIAIENWYEIFRKPDVNIGFSDPRLDAVGYRSLMVLQLAEDHYNDELIFDDVIGMNFNARIRSIKSDSTYVITVPELLESKNERIYLRGFSVQLLALLESHQIDYAFEYESVALQHGLKFLPLPDEINLSEESMADEYKRVTVKLDYQRYKTVTPIFEGLPIIYGVTIPASAPNQEEAELFVEFLLSDKGQQILAKNHQPSIIPPRSDNPDAVPKRINELLK
jgi:molybdate/tungstate transport system substrate-binding protein